MKGARRKFVTAMIVGLCLWAGFGTVQAGAANMKSTKGITWDLKVNKKLTYRSYWGGVGMIRQNVKMTDFSDKWSSTKAGYRDLSFTVTFTRKKKPTADQLAKAAAYYTVYHPEETTSPHCYFTIVDFKTGKSLEASNPYGVIVNSKWETSTATIYKNSAYSISMTNKRVTVNIQYPYTYKNMCIGVGGYSRMNAQAVDNNYWKGTVPFWKTKLYRSTKRPEISHFGRWWYDP